MIYLNTIKTIGRLEIKQRHGKDFERIRRNQPSDSISCRYIVFRGDVGLEEFRRLASAIKFCREASQ